MTTQTLGMTPALGSVTPHSLRIAEVFHSIQGEGRLTGTPSVFVRTTGCNLRCWFCDSAYTSWQPEGQWLGIPELVHQVLAFETPHVVLTGGEPLLQPGLVPLSRKLVAAGCHVTIETAATIERPVTASLMSISPKLANSGPRDDSRWKHRHNQHRHRPAVVRRMLGAYDCQLKFVVDQPADLTEIDSYLAEIPEITPDRVWLMPQGISVAELAERTAWLAPAAAARKFQFCQREHILLFGHVRGT